MAGPRVRCRVAALGIGLALGFAQPAEASRTWTWHYEAPGITASGTLTTTDAADAMCFYRITGITGMRNGEAITGLQPMGTPIPGNDPYAVDNMISATGPQLTKHGFGFETAAGNQANPFYADFLPTPGYLEFFSKPPFGKPDTSELPVSFSAVMAVPSDDPPCRASPAAR
jgi:hypothetical protein